MKVSWKTTLGVLSVVLIIAGVGGWLALDWLERYAQFRGVEPKPLDGKDFLVAKLDVAKIVLSFLAGAGALFALYLGVLRQNTAEQDLRDRRQAQEDTKLDAQARRVTELYTKAADQLGSDKAAVRLAGLYALERLAQDAPEQRRTIVNVFCAYLRMPFSWPLDPELDEEKRDERMQEREVRLAAQRILTTNLRRDVSDRGFWNQNDDNGPFLDLTGAVLVDFDLSRCSIGSALFRDASFVGEAHFYHTRFSGLAAFDGARFVDHDSSGVANFRAAYLNRAAFERTSFHGDSTFEGAEFGEASFVGANFTGKATFTRTSFHASADFDRATYLDAADYSNAKFKSGLSMDGAGVEWADDTDLPASVWPDGWSLVVHHDGDLDAWVGYLERTTSHGPEQD